MGDWGYGVAVDANGVYVTGSADAQLPRQTSAGLRDVFVRKYSTDGTKGWTRQFGTSDGDEGMGVATGTAGVYVTGHTRGALPGHTSAGSYDVFVRRYASGFVECRGTAATRVGTDGADTLWGTAGDDVIHGMGGNDIIYGMGGADLICGGSGDDLIQGKAGDDRLYGGAGNDRLNGGAGNDGIDGGSGRDQAVFYAAPNGANVNLIAGIASGQGSDTLTRIEDVMGSPHSDTIVGDNHRNVLSGLPGDDTLNGRGGLDTLIGSQDDDTLNGGVGDDHLYGKTGNDTLDGGDGTDTLNGGPDNDECTRGEAYESCEVLQ